MLVHDDTPRNKWHLAVVEDTIAGEDGLVRAANIRTSTGRANHPIVKLYPLEVAAEDPLLQDKLNEPNSDKTVQPETQVTTSEKRPVYKAALQGRKQIREWTETLSAPPEDVENQ